MHQVNGSLSFWKTVVQRSFNASLQSCGSNPRKAIVSLIVTVIAAVGIALFLDADKGKDKVLWAVVVLGSSWLVILLVFLCVFFWRMPYIMHNELAEQVAKGEKQKLENSDAFKVEREQLQAEIQRIQTADPIKNMTRHMIRKFIFSLETIRTHMEQGEPDSVVQFWKLDAEIVPNLGEYGRLVRYGFLYPTPSTTGIYKAKKTPQEVWEHLPSLNSRLTSLEQILEQLK